MLKLMRFFRRERSSTDVSELNEVAKETTVSPKKARKRKKKKGRKGREVNYLENTGMADASEIEISTIANAFSKETNLAIEENHQIATSAECFFKFTTTSKRKSFVESINHAF